jgi:hypothetical protein
MHVCTDCVPVNGCTEMVYIVDFMLAGGCSLLAELSW